MHKSATHDYMFPKVPGRLELTPTRQTFFNLGHPASQSIDTGNVQVLFAIIVLATENFADIVTMVTSRITHTQCTHLPIQ